MIFELILIALLIAIGLWVGFLILRNQDDQQPHGECWCGTDELDESEPDNVDDGEAEAETDTAARSSRKLRKVWFAGGTVRDIPQAEFQQRVMAALGELSQFTNTDFVQTSARSGSYIQIHVVTDESMKRRWRDPLGLGRVPLGLQVGNQLWYRQADPRWTLYRILEGATIHEFGHRLGLRYPQNRGNTKHSPSTSDIMHGDLTVRFASASDRINFQMKLGNA